MARSVRGIRASAGASVIGWLLVAAPALGAPPATDLAPARSSARLQAIAALSATSSDATFCLTPVAQSIRSDRQHATAAVRRAFAALANDTSLPVERIVVDADGSIARFTTDRNAFDRIDVADDNANGRPDAVDEALTGFARAQRLLVGQLELPNPASIELVLARLGSDVDGLTVPLAGRQGRTRIWLDPSGSRGAAALRRAAEHQYAHAVATAAGLSPAWGEAFANWTAIAVEGSPDDRTLALVAKRLAAQGAGLVADDLDLAGGNAGWFAFLDESYGPTAVKLAVEELGRGGSDQAALDRAMRRATGDTVDAALREFQVWSLLVGPRDDGRHFSFAARLPGPGFAASLESLPALSIQADPEVGPMGAAAVLMRPGERNGGLTIRFEGDLAARWGADLLLVRDDGELHRIPLGLDAEAAGDASVPLQDVREVLLLVRNLDAEGRPAHRYSWAAHFEPGFPTEFGSLRAEPAGEDGGALVSWETSSERGLLGFNVLRARSDLAEATRVNPVWIPPLGESGGPASYSFFDATAEPGVDYRYHIEAVTLEGLASRSEAVVLTPAP
jgi:hypothetical protein